MQTTRDNTAADWFDGPLGARVLREETALARVALDDVFGFELLQLGSWGPSRHLLGGARTQHTTLLAPTREPYVTLCAPLTSLPFAADSIDAILLPHTLELVADPYAVLREAERVLVAEGCLMICGFNPYSGWGGGRFLSRHFRHRAFPPQTQRMLSENRLRDWMALLDFEVATVYGYLGSLPVTRRPRKLADDTVRQPEYRARRPLLAGAYLLKARKRVQTLTLVRPKRRSRQLVLVPASATAQVGSSEAGSKKIDS